MKLIHWLSIIVILALLQYAGYLTKQQNFGIFAGILLIDIVVSAYQFFKRRAKIKKQEQSVKDLFKSKLKDVGYTFTKNNNTIEKQ